MPPSLTKRQKGVTLIIIVLALFIYGLGKTIYLHVVGEYTVAVLEVGTPTSEGIDLIYRFEYRHTTYNAVLTGIGHYSLGDKAFVLFSPKNPSNNMVVYWEDVPTCLNDSVSFVWQRLPKCEVR
jgi:hypothetical protein